jgi:hypothetical protein
MNAGATQERNMTTGDHGYFVTMYDGANEQQCVNYDTIVDVAVGLNADSMHDLTPQEWTIVLEDDYSNVSAMTIDDEQDEDTPQLYLCDEFIVRSPSQERAFSIAARIGEILSMTVVIEDH